MYIMCITIRGAKFHWNSEDLNGLVTKVASVDFYNGILSIYYKTTDQYAFISE